MESAIVGALVTITLPMVIKGIKTNLLVKPDLQSIQSELEIILAIIGGHRWKGKKTSDLRTTWVAQLRILAADIEYCVDNFLVKTTSAAQFAREIRELKRRIQESSERLKGYTDQDEANNEVLPTPMMNNNAEEDLLTLLESKSEMKAKVISAIGSGCQNTDLARRVYEKDEVRRQFSKWAWVSAVDKSLDDVLAKILEEFEPGQSSSDVRNQLESRLGKQSYLIVIDKVSTVEVYNGISSFSWANGVGGRIIVTTNIEPVARACICGDAPPPVVRGSNTAGLVLVGEVGGKFYEETCFTLCDAAIARTEGLLGSDYERVILEDCLLYFSMFPRGHDVRTNPLIRRWVAEGIPLYAKQKVNQYANLFDEQIVAMHLDNLIRHNFIKTIMNSNSGKVKRCQPPGMVFNHICSKAMFENFFTLLCGPRWRVTANQEYVRRLSLHPYLNGENGGLIVPNVRRLLTMLVFPTAGAEYGSILRFDQHKLLRVLDLKECAHLEDEHVAIICDMLLLKYLSLGNSVDCMPRKIGRLKWLETLDMRTDDVVTVYSEVFMLPKLKHLLGKFQLASEDCPDENPSRLKKRTKEFLKYKDDFSKLKEYLTRYSVLETLAGVLVSNGVGLPQLLSHMLRLRKLKIWCDSSTKRSTNLTHLKEGIKEFISNGTRMTHVDYTLSIDFQGSSQPFLYCLEEVGRLTSLKLSGSLILPTPVTFLIRVQELCLAWTNLRGAEIHRGLLSLSCKLKFLKLVEKKLEGFGIKNEGPFESLERICLVGTESLDQVIIQDLSNLVSLHLLCKTLGDLPGIRITSLRNLGEIGLHAEVDDAIKHRWVDAANVHERSTKVVSIEGGTP